MLTLTMVFQILSIVALLIALFCQIKAMEANKRTSNLIKQWQDRISEIIKNRER